MHALMYTEYSNARKQENGPLFLLSLNCPVGPQGPLSPALCLRVIAKSLNIMSFVLHPVSLWGQCCGPEIQDPVIGDSGVKLPAVHLALALLAVRQETGALSAADQN